MNEMLDRFFLRREYGLLLKTEIEGNVKTKDFVEDFFRIFFVMI